jgi:hypothetical protein
VRTIGNLTAMGMLIGMGVGIPLFVYLALDAILDALRVVLYALGFALAGGGAFVAVVYWRREDHRRYRVIDGSLPMQRHRVEGVEIVVDPNKVPGAAYVVGPGIGYREIESVVGPQVQLLIDQYVQHTRSLAAISPGDDALVRTRGMIAQPRLPASVTKMMPKPPKLDDTPPPPTVLPQPEPARLPASPQQLVDAAGGPQPTRLAIGEDPVSGEIIAWNLELHPFARVHGATQSGKTSLARLIVAQAIRHGFEVVILDRRRGKDWGIFRNHAELVDARDSAVLVAALEEECIRYADRDALLGKHSAPNLAALAAATGQSYRRRLLVIEELGTQTLNAQAAGQKVFRPFIGNLRRLTAEAGATGIHGLYIDQIPDQWDKAVRYNASGAIVFHLPDHGGQVAGYQMAHKLEPYHCHYDGAIVRAGHLTDDQLRRTIAAAPAPVRSAPPPPSTGGEHPANTPNTNTPANTPDPSDNARIAAQFCADNPEAGVNALARHLARLDNRPDEWRNFQGAASPLWHRYNPRGNDYQPPEWVGSQASV